MTATVARKTEQTPLARILSSEGRTRQWLADVTGIPYGPLSRIVSGKRLPNVIEAHAIARALRRGVVEVFGLDEPAQNAA